MIRNNHYSDAIWARCRLKSPASSLFTQPFIQVQIKENTKAPHHWHLWGISPATGEFPAQMASNVENVSILMTSSCSDILSFQSRLWKPYNAVFLLVEYSNYRTIVSMYTELSRRTQVHTKCAQSQWNVEIWLSSCQTNIEKQWGVEPYLSIYGQ